MVKKDVKKQQNKSVYKAALTVLIGVVLILSITRVVFSNILATSGQRLAAANQEAKLTQEQNQKLENEASSLDSLARIEKLATDTGLVKATNVEILVPSKPIASR
jgi:flagellar biosynthesis/type III secretory pathway M-ring protein FliF/YscJ